MLKPADCHNKPEIRAEIDRIDRALVDLLVERFGYVRRMAELKQDPGEAYIQERVDEVLDRVAAEAEAKGLGADLVRSMWKTLIDWNVDYESRTIAARKQSGTK